MTNLILLALGAYLVGSINFSIILFRVLGRGDPRDQYSGNAGTVNVTRQLGRIWGGIILVLDIARAGAIAQIGVWLLPAPFVPLLGFFLVLGNQRPLFHSFRGGKGVASYLGFTAFISPISAGVSCLAWVIAYGLFRQPFIGSFFMIGVLGIGTMARYFFSWKVVLTVGLTMVLIFLSHRSNIIAYGKKSAT